MSFLMNGMLIAVKVEIRGGLIYAFFVDMKLHKITKFNFISHKNGITSGEYN